MIDPITEALLAEVPSDSMMQTQFKTLVDKETEKCEKLVGSPGFNKCKILATSFAVKKFMYKYGDAPDKVVEMAQEKLNEMKKLLEKKDVD